MYEIYLERRAERDLKKISSPLFDKILYKIKSLRKNPRPTNCKKITDSKSDYRIRIGDYRVIYEIRDKEKEIRIMRVRNRKEVYR